MGKNSVINFIGKDTAWALEELKGLDGVEDLIESIRNVRAILNAHR